ncbi:MAG: adenylate/guanylate cyclase domain-containing protein [Parachlamydiales bacterium]|nr:adenylate/guanylate cyclase domain-containing protein [Parachlamydiales bacterium]
MGYIRSFIFSKTVLSILVIACLMVTGLDLYIENSQYKIIRFAAITVAENEVDAILELSKAYQQGQTTPPNEVDIISRFNQNLKEKPGGLTVEAITKDSPKSDLQQQAYQYLLDNPEKAFYWLEEKDEQTVFHYAVHFEITKEKHEPHTIMQLNIPMGEFQKVQDSESKKALWVLSLFGIATSLVLAIFVGYTRYSAELLAESQKKDLEYQKTLTSAYERFFPREFLDLLGKKNILDVQLGDQAEKTMAVLFSDIRNFTTILEKKSTSESFKFINDFMGRAGPVVREHFGFIDKYIGDSIMALFAKPDHALDASVKMLSQLKQEALNPENLSKIPIEIGIGLNFGPLMVGTVGELQRMDGTVFSDVVNTASRLESLNKAYGTSLLISDAFLNSLENKSKYRVRFVDQVYVKGKTNSVKIYEIFDVDSPEIVRIKEQIRDDYQKAVELYQKQQFQDALNLLQKCQTALPQDIPTQIYIKRCNKWLAEAPKEGWDPYGRLAQKYDIE